MKIKLDESKLKEIVAESVKKVLEEENAQTEMNQNEVWKTRFFNQACQAAAWLNSAVSCYNFDPERQDGAAKLALKAHKLLWDMMYQIRDRQKYYNELLDVDSSGRVN
jgi:hypothetical protein